MDKFFLWGVVGGIVGLVVHEAGHWGAARIAGLTVTHVSIGEGPRLWRGRLAATPISLHAVPLCGFVSVLFDPMVGRGRLAFFTLGGVLANLALMVALILVAELKPFATVGRYGPMDPYWAVWPGLIWSQLLIILGCLFPSDKYGVATDGMQLLRLMRGR